MIIYKCDMCGKTVSSGNDLDSITVLCESEEQLPFGDGKKKFDVCADCSRKIGGYIESNTQKQNGKERLLDAGRIVEDAGDAGTLNDFYVIDMGDGEKEATRSRLRVFSANGSSHPPLTRRDLYRGRMGEAECEYAHAFMCGGFPNVHDPERPSKDEWLDQKPYEFEVDKFVTDMLFR